MKNILLLLFIVISCRSYPQQTIVPLRTYDIPEDAGYYMKDTNNELEAFEGTWKGIWDNKIIYLTLKKITNEYREVLKYNKDYLTGSFKTVDHNGTVLFDNTALINGKYKIRGTGFQKTTDKYLMTYFDKDLCRMSGDIEITFANTAKTQLNFSFHQDSQVINSDCYFHGWQQADRPQPLPKTNIILTKQ